ncbi:MAG: hypothetical protein PSX81_07940 [bacterium]|nr:hypothetical protein [bacterium]
MKVDNSIFVAHLFSIIVSFIDKLKQRWQVKSALQVVLILLVFTCTGCSIIPIKHFLGINSSTTVGTRVLFYIGVFPIYNIMLLAYGFIFGQFRFFLNFEKKFFKRILNLFIKKK